MKEVTFKFTDEQWALITTAFIRQNKIPMVDGEPKYTNEQWLKLCGINYYDREANKGAKLLRLDAAEGVDPSIKQDIINNNI